MLSLFFCACGGPRAGQIPKVYQAWDARYQYDLENRRIISKYEDKNVGRAIGRDQWGRVDYDKYWVMRPFKGENLLKFHEDQLESQREARWEEANREAIEARKLELSQIANQKDKVEEPGSTESNDVSSEEVFLPAPFLPQGIDMNMGDESEENGEIPSFENAPPPIPMENEDQLPSPFDPLPPL